MNERIEELKEKERESTMQTANQNKGAIEITRYKGADFNVDNNFQISKMPFDTLLVHFEDGDADVKKVGDIFVPLGANDTNTKAWRTGKVIMAGTGCQLVVEGDYVTFPNDKGINAKSVNVKNYGVIQHCIFIAEDRIFAIAEKVEQ